MAALILMMAYMDTIVIKGGTHQCAHASQRVIYENGGEIYHGKPVEKIIVENGKATGLKLVDGTVVEGRLGVVCGANPIDLVHDLTEPDMWSDTIQQGVKALKRDFVCISWYTWALREQPEYKAAAFNPDLKDSSWINLTERGLDLIAGEVERRASGKWPLLDDFHLGVANWSNFAHDYYAPPGGQKATILTEHFVLPATKLSDAEWKKMEKQHADEIITHWGKYCPNVNWDNVIGYVPVTPHYTAKHSPNYAPEGNWCVIDQDGSQFGVTRPIPELADLRNFPIENLYPCSSAWHPRGGATSQQGRWVYKIIAEKNGLPMPPKKDWTNIVMNASEHIKY
jgi:phytoene dehydrogenase-like protein